MFGGNGGDEGERREWVSRIKMGILVVVEFGWGDGLGVFGVGEIRVVVE